MEAVYRRVAVAAKNQDNREHDIVDSDDYFQYHGGMVAAVRALTGRSPAAYVGDSATPDAVKTRTLRRGDQAGVPRPRGQPALDRGDAAARLQGRVRDGGDGGLPVRLRRHRGGRRRLDVRAAQRGVRVRRDQPRVHGEVQPVGAARHRRTPARGSRSRSVGGAGGRHARPATRRPTCELEGDLEGPD